MNRSNIPSEEEFERASAAMREYDRGLSDVSSRILRRFKEAGLHEIFVFYSPSGQKFGVHLFYRRDDQIKEAEASGLSARIKQAVIEELENVGRGSRDMLMVEFTFDSHENVEANYGGNYFQRLR